MAEKRLRFIKAVQLGDIVDRKPPKTKVWVVRNTQARVTLGFIRWFGRWRQYSFFPEPELVFERGCLRTIADFCERNTRSHYAKRRGVKSTSSVSR